MMCERTRTAKDKMYDVQEDENGEPSLYVFSNCKSFIRTVPALCYSETDVEDIDTSAEDHIYDELRYVLMEHPITPVPKCHTLPQGFDPLS